MRRIAPSLSRLRWMPGMLLALALMPRPLSAASPIPPLPRYYVYDEAGLLTSLQQKALETILIEHAQATGEELLIGIFKGLDGADAAGRTHRIFEGWLASRGKDDAALLALYDKEMAAQLESGYGMETLDESGKRAIIQDDLLPELKAGHPFRALGLSVLDILRAAESPLIESGRAEQLLQEGGIDDRMMRPSNHPLGPGSWLGFVLLGALLFGGVLNNLLAAEAHFTADGWYRPNPWKLLLQQVPRPGRRGAAAASGGLDGRW